MQEWSRHHFDAGTAHHGGAPTSRGDTIVVDLTEVDRSHVGLVGGKGAHLGELHRVDGVDVPAGFCVTTDAYRRIIAAAPAIENEIDRLARLDPDDREAIRVGSAAVREAIEQVAVPDDLAAAITGAVARLGADGAYAVRSSATAEDLPGASFAGQQDSYLNVVGPDEVLRHVVRCWASLFTERAVTYRQRNGFDHRQVTMAVVVQRMVVPQVSGVLFTADPVSSNRRVVSVEAIAGLGEALVAGQVSPDTFKVRDGRVVERVVAPKAGDAATGPGGTGEAPFDPARQEPPVLTDDQVLALADLGRRIEAHFGSPQDIEWCLADDGFHVVQSRPITTLFPIPSTPPRPLGPGSAAQNGQSNQNRQNGQSDQAARSDQSDQASAVRANRVFISVGHQQMMTDAMRPLGLSVWQLTTPRPMAEAGSRLFVDVTELLTKASSRANLLAAMGRSDPLIADALQTVIHRPDFLPPVEEDDGPAWGLPGADRTEEVPTDPSIVTELIAQMDAALEASRQRIMTASGPARLDAILDDIADLRGRVQADPRSMPVIMAGMQATWWLNDRLEEWLGGRNAADVLTQSVDNNVSAEMGLALLDVADAIRPHAEVVAFLREVAAGTNGKDGDAGHGDSGFLDRLDDLDGGPEAKAAIQGFLDRYGMRCVGEIDITRPRWSEQPAALLPVILGNVDHFEPGAGPRRFEQGRKEAHDKAEEILARLRELPDGEAKAEETRRMIDRARAFNGYREYPKYHIVGRYFVYKQALLAEADRLVEAGVLRDREDAFFLRFEELHEAVRTHRVDEELIARRKADFRAHQALTPPRVITSDGEGITGVYRRDDRPASGLIGLPVSAGTVEGRARVIRDMADADVAPGDILVTAFTDPSWSPLFVTIGGLVTEVGGLMTHGAVVAREYGLPAVVGVQGATDRIPDGRRIRLNGTDGTIELL
ncbi:MAG TPA: rifamycin-inactivating phosphotransferase [Acidimicrobiales bacterium]